MKYGVVRVIAEELRWLTVSGKYADLDARTWVTSDKSVGYSHARSNRGLLLKIGEASLENARRCPQNRSVEQSAVLIPATESECRGVAQMLREWRARNGS